MVYGMGRKATGKACASIARKHIENLERALRSDIEKQVVPGVYYF